MCDNDGCTSLTSDVQSLLDNLSVINDSDIIQVLHCYRADLTIDETLLNRDIGSGYCCKSAFFFWRSRLIIIKDFIV